MHVARVGFGTPRRRRARSPANAERATTTVIPGAATRRYAETMTLLTRMSRPEPLSFHVRLRSLARLLLGRW